MGTSSPNTSVNAGQGQRNSHHRQRLGPLTHESDHREQRFGERQRRHSGGEETGERTAKLQGRHEAVGITGMATFNRRSPVVLAIAAGDST